MRVGAFRHRRQLVIHEKRAIWVHIIHIARRSGRHRKAAENIASPGERPILPSDAANKAVASGDQAEIFQAGQRLRNEYRALNSSRSGATQSAASLLPFLTLRTS